MRRFVVTIVSVLALAVVGGPAAAAEPSKSHERVACFICWIR